MNEKNSGFSILILIKMVIMALRVEIFLILILLERKMEEHCLQRKIFIILENVIIIIFLLGKFINFTRTEFLKEVYRKFGILKLGRIFILNITLMRIDIGIVIMLRLILQKWLQIINGIFQKNKS